MKLKHLLLVSLFAFTSLINAQDNKKNFIEVTGIAEMEVEPDEIIFSIGIKANDKNELATAEKNMIEVLKKNNVNEKDINFQSMYQNSYSKTMKFTKSFKFKASTKTVISQLFEDLNQKWVSSINISEIKNTKIADYKKEVKIKALKAAKDKADYLLESIGKKAGIPMEITEIEDYTSDIVMPRYYAQAKVANLSLDAASDDNQFSNIENIKLKYSIKTKYEIQ
ncbi:SIMPL domain-containing protein [Chryseobacterium sp. T1]